MSPHDLVPDPQDSRGATAMREARYPLPRHWEGLDGPEDVAISEDAARLVWFAAASLEPQHREALNLSVRHGLTYREAGGVLGLRPARAPAPPPPAGRRA